MTKTIKAIIPPVGAPTIEAVGFNGVGCESATAAFEKALGGEGAVSKRDFKPEWSNPEDETEKQEQGLTW